MDICKLTPNDLDALLALYRHLHHTDDPPPPADELNLIWAEIVSSKRFQYFGGVVGGALVSSCTISVIPNLTRGGRPYGLIENVVTHADFRRRGLGTAVVKAALAHAWGEGCYKVMLQTGRKDEATRRFYQSAGFNPDGKQAFLATSDR